MRQCAFSSWLSRNTVTDTDHWRSDPWAARQYELLTGTNPRTRKPWRVLRLPFSVGTRPKAGAEYERAAAKRREDGATRRFELALLAAWAAAEADDEGDRERLYAEAEGHLRVGFVTALRVDRDTGNAAPAGRIARLRELCFCHSAAVSFFCRT